ncbi:DUF6653 family protein [Halobaculum limi]|uniref:DUF6653 family protein n=1 Tax=Halobaculum limi TaxID=3031916 RepID=UPI00240747ED|nr:DUF6653 family protein [Halobaculum sp. YSMS11]
MNRSRMGFDVDALWNRHESPVSVWWLVLLYPVFVLTVYRRSRPLAGVLVVSLAANLLVVSPPETDDAWATRVVRGERAWLERGLRSSKVDLLGIGVGGMVNVYTLRAAYDRRPAETVVGTVASMLLMCLFFQRMADRYETMIDA